ncbi:uncharacterized protein [Penaeus vannamei]|uniref:uncharacterized protein n=1 Tax=Penaeus vannamei TaxID=6689 RepID=UPI00387F520D
MKAAKRRLGRGRNQIYAFNKSDGEVTYNKNEIQRVVEDFYRDLYHSDGQPRIEVKAGDTVPPKLFTACLEEIFTKLEWNRKAINMGHEYLNNLRLPDDIVLFSESD